MNRSLLILLTLLPLATLAQQAKVKSFTFEKVATINFSAPTEDWDINLVNVEAPAPGSNSLRAQLLEKKRQIMQQYPARSASLKTAAGPGPIVGNSFQGNAFQGVPNDNDMAISNDSVIVSVTNSRVHIYNGETEAQLIFRSLSNIASPLQVSGSKFDPKVVYDPNADRFVLVFLNGFTWGTSWIIIGFSQTNDPTGEWNLYKLYGNPLDNETWSDYPVIGISEKDLFIGINTFTNGSTNNSGFTESCLWQIGLKEGYVGFDLVTRYYHDILPQSKMIFNITPIQTGDRPSGEDMFLLSNRNTDAQNDTIFLLEVTGRVSSPNTELLVHTLTTDQPYVLPVPAKQANGHWFDTNDSRVLGGYIQGEKLHFVQSCTSPTTGRASIFYGIIERFRANNPSISSQIITEDGMDFGYPNISWSGQFEGDEESIISFNHSSETVWGGFSAVHVDGNFEASERVLIKAGESIVNVLSDSIERWGDYSGTQRVYDDNGVVWAVGSFGNGNNGHGTWIAELRSPEMSTGVSDEILALNQLVFPNPFKENLVVEFELKQATFLRLELFDMAGRSVKLLLEDRIKAGKNRLSFNAAFLPAGSYILKGTSADGSIVSEKLVKR